MGSHSAPIAQEYFLQGSVLDSTVDGGRPVDVLLHRLRGLCDQLEPPRGETTTTTHSTTTHHREGHSVQTFHELEQVYAVKTNVHGPVTQLRARRSLDPARKTAPTQLRYIGAAETEKTKATMTRQLVDVSCAPEGVAPFLDYMGFRLDHEFVVKGFLFRKGKMKVVVSKLYKILAPGKLEQLEPLTASHLVELSVVAPGGVVGGGAGTADPVGDDMRAFAETLKPLVNLEKVDARRWT